MEYKDVIKKVTPEFDKAMQYLEREMAKIHTGRASANIIEDLVVDCFDQKFPLKQLAMISVPEPRQIVVQPWDKSYFEPIQKAIAASQLGLSPAAEGAVIRINMPDLTSEYRQSLVKVISKVQEDTRQAMRRARDDAWSQVQKLEREGEVREDDKFKAKDELQKMIDNYGKKIDEAGDRKKKEISE
ncbi:MAG: ribosome recycling factor [Candidatus Pacebacteria bacterium]|jgi:ribosome recycling factor|nr:ribosome recycling factor [Candidatus Paceibacterota bacterium]